jgi:hypothetical protein
MYKRPQVVGLHEIEVLQLFPNPACPPLDVSMKAKYFLLIATDISFASLLLKPMPEIRIYAKKELTA